MYPPTRQRGMTLLEMLVALTIASLLVLLLVRTQATVLGAWRRQGAETRLQQELAACRDTLLRQVRSAVSFRPPRSLRRLYTFWGTPHSLTFVTSQALAPGSPPGLWLVTYTYVPGEEPGTGWLTAGMRPALALRVKAPAEAEPLLAEVGELRFTYLAWDRRRRRTVERPQWRDAGGGRLPLAVVLYLTVQGRRLRWLLPVAGGRG